MQSDSSANYVDMDTMTRTEKILPRLRGVGVVLILSIGFGLGLGLPSSSSSHAAAPPSPPWTPAGVPPLPPDPTPSCGTAVSSFSAVIGWISFAAWSISFYPQLVMNFERRSVVGLSFDFVLLNFVGFACYSAYNVGLFWVPAIKQQYADAHDGNDSSVRSSDVFFSLQAVVACSIGLVQIAIYDRGRQRFSRWTFLALSVFAAAAVIGAVVIVSVTAPWANAFNYLYGLSFIKLAISVSKYVPQVLLNARRRSTVGWNIDNVILDFTGGALSLTQQMIDSGCSQDWSAISGDPVKFGLGFASMFFDVIFMAQHYVCFRHSRLEAKPSLLHAHEVAAGDPT